MNNFEVNKLRFDRQQKMEALDAAIQNLNLKDVMALIDELEFDPNELKELQSRTSQLPNLYKNDPKSHGKAKALAEAINERVSGSRVDKSDEQQHFLSAKLVDDHKPRGSEFDTDEVR